MEEKPLYEHDCETCVYLGRSRLKDSEIPVDLYIHVRGLQETDLLVRYSSQGPDYISNSLGTFLRFPTGIYQEVYLEILKRAIERNVSIK